ncbi:MAG: aldo/keto reductase, partial [Gemmatimonadota bacterium]|nr:aldo/keto reductase [Gemmatimonadota bacterium]
MGENSSDITRRSFLAGMGAGLAGTLASSCTRSKSSGPGGLLGPEPSAPQAAGSSATVRRRRTAAPSSADTPMPMRILGDTGLDVSILAFGGGSLFLQLKEGDWQKALEMSVEAGINLFDTSTASSAYGEHGESEKRYGMILGEKYRDKVILSTKVDSRDSAGAEVEIEKSFQNLRTDVI